MEQKSKTKSDNRINHEQIKHLIQVGVSLSGEKNINRLLEIIVEEARKLTNADAGTLYIMSDDETKLQFAIIQNDSLNLRMGGTGGVITWPDVNLKNSSGWYSPSIKVIGSQSLFILLKPSINFI